MPAWRRSRGAIDPTSFRRNARRRPQNAQHCVVRLGRMSALTLDEVWADDLLGRRKEAELLISFLERVSSSGSKRDWARAYTLAVDAGYGVGKSFFLRRFAEHVSLLHPVAFVDAWTDDLQDDPLTALAATMNTAFAKLIDKNDEIRARWEDVLSKTGKVAKIVSGGLLRRGIGFLITESAAEAAEAALNAVDMEAGELTKALKSSPENIAPSASNSKLAKTEMAKRVAAFDAAKQSVVDLKLSLSGLIQCVEKAGLKTPVFIIIDEIDRCRPTYSIKLFEEIKHLFDVEGIVFVFGMHQRALARSVEGAYGPGFDGWSYLKRFINRTYNLTEPNLAPLLNALIKEFGVDEHRLEFPTVKYANGAATRLPISQVIADYMTTYGHSARDAHYVIETIQTCLLITGDKPLLIGYLVPLILSSRNESYTQLPIDPPIWQMDWSLNLGSGMSPSDYITNVRRFATMTIDQLINDVNRNHSDLGIAIIELVANQKLVSDPLAHPNAYPTLLESVARFD